MPNKNSIESEIANIVSQKFEALLVRTDFQGRKFWQSDPEEIKKATKEILALIQREVKKGRVEELKRNAYYSQPRKTDPLKLCGIDMTAKQVLDRLEELENDS